MREKMKIREQVRSGMRVGEYCPGNGIRYLVIAVPWNSEDHNNLLGSIYPGGWLVINCNTKLAYLFQKDGPLADWYIREKLGGSEEDYPYIADLVRAVLERPGGKR